MKKVFVTNIPVHAYVDGWVEVLEGTDPEKLNEALAETLCEKGYEPETRMLKVPDDTDLDEGTIKGGWVFSTPLEKS